MQLLSRQQRLLALEVEVGTHATTAERAGAQLAAVTSEKARLQVEALTAGKLRDSA
jgi:hypothetical protein